MAISLSEKIRNHFREKITKGKTGTLGGSNATQEEDELLIKPKEKELSGERFGRISLA